MFTAAVVQLSCTSNQDRNLAQASHLIERAAAAGAHWVGTPENTNFLGPHDVKIERAETLDGPTCSLFSELASRLGIHLLLGSFNERLADDEEAHHRCYNTSVLFGPDGGQLAVYRKIHLFDVDVSDQVRFKESDTTKPGNETVVVETPLAPFGLSICYDLRFPEMYRKLVDAGAQVLTVPSAFTLTTGKDHWYPLLRARAIETESYVLAPAQVGHHDDNGLRQSYGHALIVDPWGQVLAAAPPDKPGFALAEIDLDHLASVRRGLPVHLHRRL